MLSHRGKVLASIPAGILLEFCMAPGMVDVVIASGEFRKEELTRFAMEGRRRGFSGLIVQVADAPETTGGTSADRTIRMGDFILDASNRRVWVRDAEVQFRPREFDLLTFLCAHADQHLSHRTLAADLGRSVIPCSKPQGSGVRGAGEFRNRISMALYLHALSRIQVCSQRTAGAAGG